jgi:hypothetical protein
VGHQSVEGKVRDDFRYHQCDPDERRELVDARGIFCCFVCDVCEAAKRRKYRSDIFEDADYWTWEPVEEDE